MKNRNYSVKTFQRKEDVGTPDMDTVLRRACISARASYMSKKPENRDPSDDHIEACEKFVLTHANSAQVMDLVNANLLRMPAGSRRPYVNLNVGE